MRGNPRLITAGSSRDWEPAGSHFFWAGCAASPLLAEFMGGDMPEMRAKFVASLPCIGRSRIHHGACPEVDGGRRV